MWVEGLGLAAWEEVGPEEIAGVVSKWTGARVVCVWGGLRLRV